MDDLELKEEEREEQARAESAPRSEPKAGVGLKRRICRQEQYLKLE